MQKQPSSPHNLQYSSSMAISTVSSTILVEDEENVGTSSPDYSYYESKQARRKHQRRNPSVLVQWLERHTNNPYPTKQEKQHLALLSEMSLRQLNDWFANARRNIKKMGFDVWRKKRHGVPNHKIRSSSSFQVANPAPPNRLTNRKQLSSALPSCQQQQGSSITLPMAPPIPNFPFGPSRSQVDVPFTSKPSFTTTPARPLGLFPGTTSWPLPPSASPYHRHSSMSATGPVLSMSRPPIVQPPCYCVSCMTGKSSPGYINPPTVTEFTQPTKLASLPLTSIPWTLTSTPSAASGGGSYPFGTNFMSDQEIWGKQESPTNSCPDISISPLPPDSSAAIPFNSEAVTSSISADVDSL